MTLQVFRYRIPTDGTTRTYKLRGPVVALQQAESDAPDEVDIWAEHRSSNVLLSRTFQVFGTGRHIPEDAQYIGTTLRDPDNGDVWHIYDITGCG